METEKNMVCEKKKQIKALVETGIFLAVVVCLFVGTMYLFRTYNYNREQLNGIAEEDAEVVYIGGSAAFTYWQPHKAWKDFGFSSYAYGSDSLQAEAIKFYIKNIEKTQDPSLYVIDARPFQYWEEEVAPSALSGLQYSLDTMRLLDPNRFLLAHEYWQNHYFEEKSSTHLSLLDITKPHENTGNLGDKNAWDYLFNKLDSELNGHLMVAWSVPLHMPADFVTEKRAQLHPTCQSVLVDLLEWCKEQDHNVLFVVCPYAISQKHQEKYNSISDLVREYGYQFLNTNMYYEQMGIDFYKDFYNKNHVNPIGAEKYTEFLAKYIWENYSIPTVTDSVAAEMWADEYEEYVNRQEVAVAEINQIVVNTELLKTRCQELREIQDLMPWSLMAQHPDIVLLVAQSGTMDYSESSEISNVLCKWGFLEPSTGGISVITDFEITDTSSTELAGALDLRRETPYSIYVDDSGSTITIGAEAYSLLGDGMNIVAFDNRHGEVADVIQVRLVNGELVLQR